MASITSSVGSLFSGVTSIFSGLIESILAVFTHAFNVILSVFNVALSTVQQLFAAVLHTFEGVLSTLTNVFGDLVGIVTGECTYRYRHCSNMLILTPSSANIAAFALAGVAIVAALSLSGSKKAPAVTKSAGGRKKKA